MCIILVVSYHKASIHFTSWLFYRLFDCCPSEIVIEHRISIRNITNLHIDRLFHTHGYVLLKKETFAFIPHVIASTTKKDTVLSTKKVRRTFKKMASIRSTKSQPTHRHGSRYSNVVIECRIHLKLKCDGRHTQINMISNALKR